MAISKVVYDGDTLVDLTSDTVQATSLLSGTTAHSADGSSITGQLKLSSVYYFAEQTTLSFDASTQSIAVDYTFDSSMDYLFEKYTNVEVELSEDTTDIYYVVDSLTTSGMTITYYYNTDHDATTITANVCLSGIII